MSVFRETNERGFGNFLPQIMFPCKTHLFCGKVLGRRTNKGLLATSRHRVYGGQSAAFRANRVPQPFAEAGAAKKHMFTGYIYIYIIPQVKDRQE